MAVSDTEKNAFRAAVERNFAFLSDVGHCLVGVDCIDEDPRDSYLVARYRGGSGRVDVAWAPVEMSLSVLLRLEKSGLSRREQSVYAEPYIEFITQGKATPVIPQIYPAMGVSRIQRTMAAREKVFEGGLAVALEALAGRFKEYYPQIRDASVDAIRAYHAWYKGGGDS